MRVVWCTLWFLDYRIPVFKELSKIAGVDFYLVYNKEANPERVNDKIKEALGDRVIAMTGEKHIGKKSFDGFANKGFRIPIQPKLIKTIKDLKPDVMISDGFFQWTYATLYLRAFKGIPHVMCYERTMHTERNAQKIRTVYRKKALRFIDAICCSGKLSEDYIRFLGFKGEVTKGFMVSDALPGNGSRTTENEKNNAGEPINYLFVGRLIELKGIKELVDAWKLFSMNKSVKLTLVGDGDLKEFILDKIAEYHLKDKIEVVGMIDFDSIGEFYRKADIFILPTLEDNWSLVVPEAMKFGLPIITSIYNGCYYELVRPDNGWVMDPRDEKNFIDTLENSYKSKESFEDKGAKSFEIVSEFNSQNAAMAIYNACKAAIKIKG